VNTYPLLDFYGAEVPGRPPTPAAEFFIIDSIELPPT
jgi:hypothetical protein